jgi:hypothetical protein
VGLLDWFGAARPSRAEVRVELWNLGVRHHGEPLAGAQRELEAEDAGSPRAMLLRACLSELRRKPA